MSRQSNNRPAIKPRYTLSTSMMRSASQQYDYMPVLPNNTMNANAPSDFSFTCPTANGIYGPVPNFYGSLYQPSHFFELHPCIGDSNEMQSQFSSRTVHLQDPSLGDSAAVSSELQKTVFNNAISHKVDPNTYIDELCKLDDISEITTMILDHEFGPKYSSGEASNSSRGVSKVTGLPLTR